MAASGWGAELIPEEQILQSQFPEVLAQIEKDQTRIAELEGLFAAANETVGEDEDADLENVDTENGVLPKALVKALKDERKLHAGEIKEAKRQAKAEKRIELSAVAIVAGMRQDQSAHPGGGKVQGQRAADAADARNQHRGVLQAELPGHAEALDPELPLVDRAFVVGE